MQINPLYITILGVVAGTCTALSMLPQVIKTIREKKAEQVSKFMLISLISGVVLWMVYGILKKDWPIIITNALSLLLNIIMFFLRKKYKRS